MIGENEDVEDGIEERIKDILEGEGTAEERLLWVCRLLRESIPRYDWVGFYVSDPEEDGMLVLGPFAGEPTEHVKIPFGRGICGQAAATGRVFLVRDVSL